MAHRTRGKSFPKEIVEKLESYDIKGTGKEYAVKIAAAAKSTGLSETQVIVSFFEYSLYVHALRYITGGSVLLVIVTRLLHRIG